MDTQRHPARTVIPRLDQRTLLAVLGVPLLIVLSCCMPLALYAVSLACFGLAHVAYELRYVDARFGQKLAPRRALGLVCLGLGIMLVRGFFVAGLGSTQWRPIIEASSLVVFAGAAYGWLPRSARVPRICSAAIATLLGAGAIWAPVLTLALFSLLHNATPIGFLVEAAPAQRRARALLLSCLIFLGLPAVTALVPVECSMPAALDLDATVASSWLHVTPHEQALRLAPQGLPDLWVPRLFRAAVVAQILHYFATIVWLPRLNRSNQDQFHRLPWPSPRQFALGITASSVVLLVAYLLSFRNAHALYSIPAAFHAWLEIPILLIALSGTWSAKPANQT